jgi:3-phenylpropionate/trans-cinnamate dioxygenase ferredoxin reductase subunit
MMRQICKVVLNNEHYLANAGDLLLDWALMNGLELPHDCRAGMCGACRVRLVEGRVFGGHEPGDDMIHACQARIVSDIAILTEDVPDPASLSGRVAGVVRLAPDIAGVTIEVPKSFSYLPGQFCKLQFRGYPSRSYSPTYPLQGRGDDRLLHFHIRRLPDGKVSAALGRDIGRGHRVRLSGPFGSAFLRRNHRGPIVLVAGGTGFAPMWSIAVAAIMERPERELTFIVGARELRSLYCHSALCRLALFPNVTIIPVVAEPQSDFPAIRSGLPTEYLTALSPNAVVYTSGVPAMTESVGRIARAAGARCYADPFLPTTTPAEQARARRASQ